MARAFATIPIGIMNCNGRHQNHVTTTNVDVFNCRRLPARLLIEQVALLLGFQLYQLVMLVAAGHLECLGDPRPNSIKWFSAAYILALALDVQWMDQATKIVARTARKNSRNNLLALTKSSQLNNSFATNT